MKWFVKRFGCLTLLLAPLLAVLRLKTKAQFLSELCFLMPHNLNYHLKMGNKRPPSISVSHDFR